MIRLNPSACAGTGGPLISPCLMRDIDRPHPTWRTTRRPDPRASPAALVDGDEIKRGEDASVKCWETKKGGQLLAGP